MVQFKNQDQRLKTEYNDLPARNSFLAQLLQDLDKYVQNKFKKELVVTMIGRTTLEQAEIYKDDPKFKIRAFKSPHQLWHALDLRSKTFTDEEVKDIEDYLNKKYNGNNAYAWTARNHEVANHGEHFHIQYYPKT